MKNKITARFYITFIMIIVMSVSPVFAEIANPASATVFVNGKNVSFDAYNINDNNYFKLRDLAFVLSGTEKQFEVVWDSKANAISLTRGKPYTAVGGEMAGKSGGVKTAGKTTSTIFLNGAETKFTAYNIEGSNYFKLRDVGAALNFSVEWDGAKNTIVIDTGRIYAREGAKESAIAGLWRFEDDAIVGLYLFFTDNTFQSVVMYKDGERQGFDSGSFALTEGALSLLEKDQPVPITFDYVIDGDVLRLDRYIFYRVPSEDMNAVINDPLAPYKPPAEKSGV